MSLTERVVYTTNYASKPQIIVPKHPSWHLDEISFVPIKGNQILLFAKYFAGEWRTLEHYLHLSIHKICSDHRVGPALWSFNGSVDGHLNVPDLKLIRSTENALGITFAVRFEDHWKLFDISTTETDTLNNFPLIEWGRVDCDIKFKLKSKSFENHNPGRLCLQFLCSRVEVEPALMFSKSHYPLTRPFSYTWILRPDDKTKRLTFITWILVVHTFPSSPACLFPFPG